MAHHRGLIITLVVAVVVAVVGIGVMGLTTNDTDESAHDDLAVGNYRSFGLSASDDGAQPNDSRQTITIFLSRGYFNVKPVYDAANNCVKGDANSPGDVNTDRDPYPLDLSVTVVGGVFEDCGYEESRMHWVVHAPPSGAHPDVFENVYLKKSPGKDTYAVCGGGIGFECNGGGPGRDSVSLRPL